MIINITRQLQDMYNRLEDKLGIPRCYQFLDEYGLGAIAYIIEGHFYNRRIWQDFLSKAFAVKHNLNGRMIKLTADEVDALEMIVNKAKDISEIRKGRENGSVYSLIRKGLIKKVYNGRIVLMPTNLGTDLLDPGQKLYLRIREKRRFTNKTKEEIWQLYINEYRGIPKSYLSKLDPSLYRRMLELRLTEEIPTLKRSSIKRFALSEEFTF